MPEADITPEQQQALADEAAIDESDATELSRALLDMTHAELLPPKLAARFTMGEVAVLRSVADEFQARGAFDLCIDAIAARAGVCRPIVKNAMRWAAADELVVVIKRRRPAQKNLPNTVRIISREWKS